MHGRRVLLVNPWIHDFAAYDLWARPTGLLRVGAVLRENGCRVDLIDCLAPQKATRRKPTGQGKFPRQPIEKPPELVWFGRTYARYGMSVDEFRRQLEGLERPDAVLVTSMMTYWYPGVIEAITLVREILGDVLVILGGVYATLCQDHARRKSGADIVVAGEGVERIVRLLCEIWGCAPDYIPDPWNLDSLPYPCFDLMEDTSSVCIQTSRGCPYNCPYCAVPVLSPKRAVRDVAGVVDEIVHWHKNYGARDFAFLDDALLVPGQRALDLVRGIARLGLDARFHCPNALHAREITRELAGLMREAGFVTIRLGLETSDPASQGRYGGKVTNSEFLSAVEALHGAGYTSDDIGVYILCGLPGQDPHEVEQSADFVRKAGARPYLAEYSPVPGSALWERAVKQSPFPLEKEPLFHNNTLMPCATDPSWRDVLTRVRSSGRLERQDIIEGSSRSP